MLQKPYSSVMFFLLLLVETIDINNKLPIVFYMTANIVREKNRIEARLRFPNFSLTLESNKPEQSLRELHKILASLRDIEASQYVEDSDLMWRLGYLSEEIRGNTEAMHFIKTAAEIEPHIKHKKIALMNVQVFDFDQSEHRSYLDLGLAKKKLTQLCRSFEDSSYVLAHISGESTVDENNAVTDILKTSLPKSEVKTIFTHKKIGKSVVEIVFCGSFDEELS